MTDGMEKKIFLIEDHRLVREGIRLLLEREMDMRVIGEADGGEGSLEQIKKLSPNVILLDLGLPDISGLELLRNIKELFPGIKIVVLSMYKDPQIVAAAKECGADGFIAKEDTPENIIRAIREPGFHKTQGLKDRSANLTPREKQVLRLISQGLTSRQIAGKLEISVKTVDTYRQKICKKLDIHTTAGLISWAIRHLKE